MYSRRVIVLNASHETKLKAEALAKRLNLVLNPEDLAGYAFALRFNQGRLELVWLERKQIKPVWVDLSQINLKRASIKDSLLGKAIGVKVHEKPVVLDACAGLGMDALTLALLGCQVTLLERCPILFELLKDGLERIPEGILAARPLLLAGDAIDYLEQIHEANRPEVIYLDPMYPERDKPILARKEMQILNALVGEDQDASVLLEKACVSAQKRVVVKRRRLDPCLNGKQPDLVFSGKAIRFDVYLLSRV